MTDESTSLTRALSKLGFSSRSRATLYIKSGHVSLNGKMVDNPSVRVHPDKDVIEIDGKRLTKPTTVVIMLHKPRGFVATSSDELLRKTVFDLLPKDQHLFAVGRLDLDTTGLLLFTNDGTLQDKIISPDNGVAKTYLVTVRGKITGDQTRKLLKGVEIKDGIICKADECEIIRTEPTTTHLKVKIHEGKNREIRRMFEGIGKKVLSLHRTSIGKLELDIPEGSWRKLSDDEIKLIFN